MDSQTLQLLMAVFPGLVFGATISWLTSRGIRFSAVEIAVLKAQAESQAELSQLRERSNSLESSLQKIAASFNELSAQHERHRTELDQARDDVSRLSERAARVETLENNLNSAAEQLRRQSEELRRVTAEASEKASLAQSNAQKAVALERSLAETRLQMAQATADLKALTGEKATLEEQASGLRKGLEYIVQDSQTREDGSRAQPDVVIMIPEQRKLVVDSKVSLNAYEEYTVADSEEERLQAARKHLDSVPKHVLGLSTKSYEKVYGNGLDFVLMFVPIEPAFTLAISNDDRLFMDAWGRNVLLVSPSTLLFVVRTVAHLWRQEQQSRNAQDIAKRGAELYDRLVDFVKDLEQVGTRLKQARESYDDAHKRLTTGKGNVIRQAEMLRELGVKATKKLPTELVEITRGELTSAEELAALTNVIELGEKSPHSDEQTPA